MPDVLVLIGTLLEFRCPRGAAVGGGAAVSALDVAALIVALALAAYLLYALLRPERF